jgi:hypothetical protein
LDKDTNRSASSMNIIINGNLFHQRSASTDSMVGWGAGDNHTVTGVQSPAALNTMVGKAWVNLQSAAGVSLATQVAAGAAATAAVALPTNVAAAIGQSTGSKRIGMY